MTRYLAISSISLGRAEAGHRLQDRLDVAYQSGYRGIEMFLEDIESVAREMMEGDKTKGSDTGNHTTETMTTKTNSTPIISEQLLCLAATKVAGMCTQRQLSIISLQPFRNFEGLLDHACRQARIDELRLWCRLAGQHLGTDLILIPSNFLPADKLSSNVPEDLVADLRAAASLAASAQPPVRICYEALAWGTHIDTWEQSWELVCQVNQPNFGLCLDTFNIAAYHCFDSGCVADNKSDEHDKRMHESFPDGQVASLQKSMQRLVEALSPPGAMDKLFLVQLADGEALSEPLVPGHPLYDADQPARMSWSRNCRLFYGETDRGGSLPIRTIAWHILCKLGYTGWVSSEVFHRHLWDTNSSIPPEMATRGVVAWQKMHQDLGLGK